MVSQQTNPLDQLASAAEPDYSVSNLYITNAIRITEEIRTAQLVQRGPLSSEYSEVLTDFLEHQKDRVRNKDMPCLVYGSGTTYNNPPRSKVFFTMKTPDFLVGLTRGWMLEKPANRRRQPTSQLFIRITCHSLTDHFMLVPWKEVKTTDGNPPAPKSRITFVFEPRKLESNPFASASGLQGAISEWKLEEKRHVLIYRASMEVASRIGVNEVVHCKRDDLFIARVRRTEKRGQSALARNDSRTSQSADVTDSGAFVPVPSMSISAPVVSTRWSPGHVAASFHWPATPAIDGGSSEKPRVKRPRLQEEDGIPVSPTLAAPEVSSNRWVVPHISDSSRTLFQPDASSNSMPMASSTANMFGAPSGTGAVGYGQSGSATVPRIGSPASYALVFASIVDTLKRRQDAVWALWERMVRIERILDDGPLFFYQAPAAALEQLVDFSRTTNEHRLLLHKPASPIADSLNETLAEISEITGRFLKSCQSPFERPTHKDFWEFVEPTHRMVRNTFRARTEEFVVGCRHLFDPIESTLEFSGSTALAAADATMSRLQSSLLNLWTVLNEGCRYYSSEQFFSQIADGFFDWNPFVKADVCVRQGRMVFPKNILESSQDILSELAQMLETEWQKSFRDGLDGPSSGIFTSMERARFITSRSAASRDTSTRNVYGKLNARLNKLAELLETFNDPPEVAKMLGNQKRCVKVVSTTRAKFN